MNEKLQSSSKRGRKPIGDAPMTAAERKRASRARKASEGRAEFMVSVGGATLAFIDRMADANGYTRSRVVHELLEMTIARVAVAALEAEQMMASGASDDQVKACIQGVLMTPSAKNQNEEGREHK